MRLPLTGRGSGNFFFPETHFGPSVKSADLSQQNYLGLEAFMMNFLGWKNTV